MAEFAVGERALLVRYGNGKSDVHDGRYFGQTVTIISAPLKLPAPPHVAYVGGVGYMIRADDGLEWDVGVICLQKLAKPPPAREEIGSWDLCPWRPAQQPVCAQ